MTGLIFPTIWGDIATLIISLIASAYIFFQHAYTYWERKKVPYIKPQFPLGNLKTYLIRSYVMGADSADFYNELKRKGHKFGGIYTLYRPVLILTDPDYIKDVMSKDFQHFIDRGGYHLKEDPLTNHLFNIDESSWKGTRTRLTPTFTSGKMKMMFNTIVECSTYMKDFMDNKAKNDLDIDILEVLASFTTDVIGACAFGINCNSFKDTEAEFRSMGRSLFKPKSFLQALKTLLIASLPELGYKFKIKVVRKDMNDFFFDVVKKTMKFREENNISRPDFLQLLIDIQKKDPSFVLKDLVSQVFLFFVAGFDTSSATMNFALYELCKHPEIQEKVREEIKTVLEKHNNELTYESIHEMKYLGQVIDEAQRLYPPVVTLTRKCTKDYTLRDTDITIEKGTTVYIPLYGLHRDAEHYPDPEKFDPDRFSPENKADRHPYVHLPFGEGPRNCIGLRFGAMQSRVGLISILKDYKLSFSPNSKLPLTIDGSIFLIKTKEKLLLRAKKIN